MFLCQLGVASKMAVDGLVIAGVTVISPIETVIVNGNLIRRTALPH